MNQESSVQLLKAAQEMVRILNEITAHEFMRGIHLPEFQSLCDAIKEAEKGNASE